MLSLALVALSFLSQAKGGGVSFEDKVLATIPDDTKISDPAFSPDGRQVAYKAFKGGKFFVGVNGAKGPEYAGVESLKWSCNGKLAYRAFNGSTWCVVVGGQAGPANFSVVGEPIWSPDGSKVGYEACRGQGGAKDVTAWSVYVGGQKGGDYAACGSPIFSGDSASVCYNVRIGKPGVAGQRGFFTVDAVVLNGKVIPGSENENGILLPVFAPKGNRFAYRTKDAQLNFTMIVDGKPQEMGPTVGNPVWSPDGAHLAYSVQQADGNHMVVDGKKSEAFATVGEPVWSSDSKHLAYAATKGDTGFIVLDGKAQEPFGGVDTPSFSTDNTMLAYGAWKPPVGKRFMVMGDRKFDASYDTVGKPAWSSDGKKVAYQALWKYKQIIAVNDGKSELLDEIGHDGPVWSPDGKQFAVAAKKEGKWWMIVGYRREEPFDEVLTGPHWSPDSKKCAYGVRKDNQLIWRVYKVPDEQ